MTASNDAVERIAQVLREHRTVYHGSAACRCGEFSAGSSDFDAYYAHVGAAVVAELQLTQEWAAYIEDDVINDVICIDDSTDDYKAAQKWAKERCRSCDHCRNAQPKFIATRWVTGWENQ